MEERSDKGAAGAGARSRRKRQRSRDREARPDSPAPLADLIHSISRHLNELTLEDLRRFGMTVPRWSVLTQLAVRDGRTIGDLARATVIKQSSLTRVVDQMERDGLVKRRHAKDDHRRVEVWLTKQGRETYERVVPLAVHRAHEVVGGLRDRDLDQLSQLLQRMLSNLRSAR